MDQIRQANGTLFHSELSSSCHDQRPDTNHAYCWMWLEVTNRDAIWSSGKQLYISQVCSILEILDCISAMASACFAFTWGLGFRVYGLASGFMANKSNCVVVYLLPQRRTPSLFPSCNISLRIKWWRSHRISMMLKTQTTRAWKTTEQSMVVNECVRHRHSFDSFKMENKHMLNLKNQLTGAIPWCILP